MQANRDVTPVFQGENDAAAEETLGILEAEKGFFITSVIRLAKLKRQNSAT